MKLADKCFRMLKELGINESKIRDGCTYLPDTCNFILELALTRSFFIELNTLTEKSKLTYAICSYNEDCLYISFFRR